MASSSHKEPHHAIKAIMEGERISHDVLPRMGRLWRLYPLVRAQSRQKVEVEGHAQVRRAHVKPHFYRERLEERKERGRLLGWFLEEDTDS